MKSTDIIKQNRTMEMTSTSGLKLSMAFVSPVLDERQIAEVNNSDMAIILPSFFVLSSNEYSAEYYKETIKGLLMGNTTVVVPDTIMNQINEWYGVSPKDIRQALDDRRIRVLNRNGTVEGNGYKIYDISSGNRFITQNIINSINDGDKVKTKIGLIGSNINVCNLSMNVKSFEALCELAFAVVTSRNEYVSTVTKQGEIRETFNQPITRKHVADEAFVNIQADVENCGPVYAKFFPSKGRPFRGINEI